MDNEYEKLKRQGYTEEEIKVELDKMRHLEIASAPMGPQREDKGVTVVEKDDTKKRVSNVILGRNKRRVELPCGEYVNTDEILMAILESLSKDSEDRIIASRKTGKVVSVDELLDEVRETLKSEPGLTIFGPSTKMEKASDYQVKNDTALRVMLGAKPLLENGEYVQMHEILKALNDYVYLNPPKTPPLIVPLGGIEDPSLAGAGKDKNPEFPSQPLTYGGEEDENDKTVTPISGVISSPSPTSPKTGIEQETQQPISTGNANQSKQEEDKEEEKIHHVTKRRKFDLRPLIIAIVGSAIILGAASFGKNPIITETTQYHSSINNNYGVSQMVEENTFETSEQALDRILSQTAIGQNVEGREGVDFYRSSDHATDQHGTFGEGIREAGEYPITAISVLSNDDHIMKAEYEEGKNIAEVMEEVIQEKGISPKELKVRVHLGDEKIAGWVDLDDIIVEDEIVPELISTTFKAETSYSGTEEGFKDTITIDKGDGEVTLKVVDDEGKLLQDGSIINGSDGETYRIDTMGLDEKVSTTAYATKTGEKIDFSVSHIPSHAKAVAIAESILATGVVGLYLAQKAKDKKEEEKEEDKKSAEAKFAESERKYTEKSHFNRIVSSINDYGKEEENDIGNGFGGAKK